MTPDAHATIYLALGSNLGDRAANLEQARAALTAQVKLTAISPIYETEPWGISEQPHFLNQVVAGQTQLAPEALLTFLKTLERNLGRTDGIRYGPRQIDLDMLFYNQLVLKTPSLTLPHPELHKREFVLVPLADIAPDLLHPLLNESMAELLEKLKANGIPPIHRFEVADG
jgi:2-amino-4-hydroxy-6-hydroxymethyldihydropteridine diphosphokinase